MTPSQVQCRHPVLQRRQRARQRHDQELQEHGADVVMHGIEDSPAAARQVIRGQFARRNERAPERVQHRRVEAEDPPLDVVGELAQRQPPRHGPLAAFVAIRPDENGIAIGAMESRGVFHGLIQARGS
jgi:hypothetical protein